MKIIIYLITSDHLLNSRGKYTTVSIDRLYNIFRAEKYDVNIIKINKPDIEEIKQTNYKSKITLEKTNIDVIDKMLSHINIEQISNIEKHLAAYKLISDNDTIHFIIEDDIILTQEYENNINMLINDCIDDEQNWDILFACLSSDGTTLGNNILSNVNDMYKTLPAKSAYFIKPNICKKLIEYINVYKYSMKGILNRFMYENKDLRFKMYNKHTLLECTKIGLLPTSINNSNMLIHNSDYINMIKLLSNEPNLLQYEQAKTIYNKIEKLESSDVNHIMGIFSHKIGKYKEAYSYMSKAIDIIKKKQGILNKHSETLNNIINLFQLLQEEEIEPIKKLTSKWDKKLSKEVSPI
jgi:GR25 family glycosyltransferase involved in LPS biosynthesis